MWLAVREIRRSKTRFGLLSGAVGLLVFLILFQQGLLNGLITSFIGALENQDTPVVVYGEQARKNIDGSFVTPEQVAAVSQVDGVAESSVVGEGTFTVLAGGEDRDAVLFGYELGGLGEPLTLTEGRLATAPNEAVASEADKGDGFDIGAQVQIVGQDGPVITVVGLGSDLRWSVSPTLFVSYATYEAAQRAVEPNSEIVLPSIVAAAPVEGLSASDLADRINAAVAGVEALDNATAVDETPGVAAVNQSFQIILLLAFIVITLVVGFFFLILTVQKAKPLVLLRAAGAPASYLVRSLLVQIVLVLVAGTIVGLVLLAAAGAANPSGDVQPSVSVQGVLFTVFLLAVLSLLGGTAAVRRVLRIEPIKATQPGRIV